MRDRSILEKATESRNSHLKKNEATIEKEMDFVWKATQSILFDFLPMCGDDLLRSLENYCIGAFIIDPLVTLLCFAMLRNVYEKMFMGKCSLTLLIKSHLLNR